MNPMGKVFGVIALVALCLSAGTEVCAQGGDPAITAARVFGKVTEVDAPAGQMTVKTDAGSVVTVRLNEKTTYERMPPGETDRGKAVKIALADITVGDGVYARGWVAEDRKSVPAQQVVVVSQSDVAKKQEKERAEWRQRGISGIIESLNPQTKEITITTRTTHGPKPIVIPITDKVKLRRYAPDSVKFGDAKKSTFEELKVGDQLRAKGEKSADGSRFSPEELVTASFRTVGGQVTAVDAAAGEVKISDLQSKQPLTVVVRKDTTLKRVTAEFMKTTAGGGLDVQQLIDSLPAATLADLKAGETVLISSTAGADPSRVTAITLVAGVEPILALIQVRQGGPANRAPNLATINLGIGGP